MRRFLIVMCAILYVVFWIAVISAVIYLFILIIKALKKYINSKEVRKEKKLIRKSLGDVLKENSIIKEEQMLIKIKKEKDKLQFNN